MSIDLSTKEALMIMGIDINGNSMFCCPYHRESNPSARLYGDGKAYCFPCSKAFDGVNLAHDFPNFFGGVYSVKKIDGNNYNVVSPPENKTTNKRNHVDLTTYLARLKQCKISTNYLQERGFWEKLPTGLFAAAEGPISYLIIPYRDLWGAVKGVQKRLINNSSDRFVPKYIMAKGSKWCLAVPVNTFGRETHYTCTYVFITESILDAYLINNLGFFALGLPSAGYKLEVGERKFLSQKTVFFIPDNDRAGRGAKLQFEGLDGVHINDLQGCKDFGEYVQKYGRKKADNLLQEYLDTFLTEEKSV